MIVLLFQSSKMSAPSILLWRSSLKTMANQQERLCPTTSTWTAWASAWATAVFRWRSDRAAQHLKAFVFCSLTSVRTLSFVRLQLCHPHHRFINALQPPLLCFFQVTFQACSIDEARYLYDQLAPICPIVVSGCI